MENNGQNISRRAVIGAGAMAIAAGKLGITRVAAQPAVAGAGSTLPVGREVTYKSGADSIKAFLVRPDAKSTAVKPQGAVLVIHEIWGLNDHIRDVARRFAQQGYIALAPDLYSREGAPQLDVNNRAAMMEFIAALPDHRLVADLEAGVGYLMEQGAARVGSVGFCMGGLYSYLLAAKSPRLAAAVDFYGRIVYAEKTANKPESPVDLAAQLKCPLLANFGEQDASIPLADVERLRDQLKLGHQPWKVNVYPGAGHAFFNDTRPSYNKNAAADAWQEMLEFFKTHLLTAAK
jgi:carboxymethylenebutenolidase